MSQPYPTWQDVFNARRSPFYTGSTRDVLHDRGQNAYLAPSTEAMFTQSNARVLIGQSANGSLRMLALPTQVYPAPTGTGEFGLGPGMYHHFDVVMYAGDLHYQIVLEGREVIDLASDQRENQTWYADHYLPMTRVDEPGMEIHLVETVDAQLKQMPETLAEELAARSGPSSGDELSLVPPSASRIFMATRQHSIASLSVQPTHRTLI